MTYQLCILQDEGSSLHIEGVGNNEFSMFIEFQTGVDGTDGLTPFIGINGNWWIGSTDTGVAAGGGGLTPQQTSDLTAATTHINGAAEAKHGSNQVTNADALANIESATSATQATINGNVNARLFEQIAIALTGYGANATLNSQDILTSLPYAFKAYELRADFATAPTGGSAIVTFYKNGTSIGTVTILATEFVGSAALDPIVSFAKGDSLSAKITQEGLTILGATVKAYIQGIKYQ